MPDGITHRRLELSDSKDEGAFLAASLWMAQYYLMLPDREKAKTIIDAVLKFSTDLGFIAEEADVRTDDTLNHREIVVNQHCFGCTAGAGSSCGGKTT